jgi:hypothetical protein
MAKYMLLLYGDPATFAGMSPEQIQQAITKYNAWRDQLQRDKIYVSSHKLADEPGKVLGGRGGQPRVTDGPYSETKEVLAGYFMIEAASYDAAVQRSLGCPHLEYGGTIEVRQVDQCIDCGATAEAQQLEQYAT